MKKLLVSHAEGLGNCIEILPCLKTLKEILGFELDYWHAFSSCSIPKNIFPCVDKWFVGNKINKINPSDYYGVVLTFWVRQFVPLFENNRMEILNKIRPLSMTESEVNTYMHIARDLGAAEENLIWHGECNFNKMDEGYDVVISNGYNRQGSANWSIKEYPYYKEVSDLLKEKNLHICSLGAPNEYISGTVDRTGLSLLDSFGIIANSRLVLSNDSGLYHAANALGVKNVVIFTATSVEKNYDSRFHKFSTIMCREDLDCRPCQAGRGWKNCETWECREIKPEVIANKVEELL